VRSVCWTGFNSLVDDRPAMGAQIPIQALLCHTNLSPPQQQMRRRSPVGSDLDGPPPMTSHAADRQESSAQQKRPGGRII